jgi:two-component system, chemotaxis family, protein-glutamate methylesterase/glutaminase
MSAGPAPIRVAVVDDSALMRRLISSALSGSPDIEVIGSAKDAVEARELIRSTDPDVVTLDVAMPGMSGIDFLRKIMELRPTPVIMVSNLTADGAEMSLTALQIGAIDVVQKPQGPAGMEAFGPLLQAKVRLAASVRSTLPRRGSPTPLRSGIAEAPAGVSSRSLIAIGASTGGVGAFTRLLRELPDGLPPIVIVQHMPVGYPERFAARLRHELGRDISEAHPGEALQPGAVRIAPGNRHLRMVRTGAGYQTLLEEGPPVSGHCPSVDVLFESVARSAGARAVGVILTGMGRDGAMGLAAMRRAGAACLGQDRESCVVWGMPRAALETGAVEEEVSLEALPQRICQHLAGPVRERRNAS